MLLYNGKEIGTTHAGAAMEKDGTTRCCGRKEDGMTWCFSRKEDGMTRSCSVKRRSNGQGLQWKEDGTTWCFIRKEDRTARGCSGKKMGRTGASVEKKME